MKAKILFLLLLPAIVNAQWGLGSGFRGRQGTGTATLDTTDVVTSFGEVGDTEQTGTVKITQGTNITITRSAKTFTITAAGAAAANSTDSLSAAYGDEDVDKIFPSSFLEAALDTISPRTVNSNFVFSARGVGDFAILDTVNITGKLDVSGIIEAGSGNISITDATGNLDGTKVSNADLGDVAVSGGVWSVEDNSHAHDGTTISGLGNADIDEIKSTWADTVGNDGFSTNVTLAAFAYMPRVIFPDSLEDNFRWRASDTPATGDSLLMMAEGVIKKIDVGDLPQDGVGAPTDATYLTKTPNGTLSAEIATNSLTHAAVATGDTLIYLDPNDSGNFKKGVVTLGGAAGDSTFLWLKTHDTDSDSVINKPSGFSATNSEAAGAIVWQVKDGATNLASVDSTGILNAVALMEGANHAVVAGDAADGELGGTYPNPTVDDGADGTAIHDNVDAEFEAITEKVVASVDDLLLIEDSAVSLNKKKLSIGGMETALEGILDLESLQGQVELGSQVSGDLPFANLTQGSALSVLGVTGNSTADNASIAAGTDHQVLRRSGTAVAFGAVNLAQSAAITGILPVANGGTGVAIIPPIQFAADTANGLTSDTTWVWQNWRGASVIIDSIIVHASSDDFGISIVERNQNGGAGTLVDAVTASTNGTNDFWAKETTITAATIENQHWIGFKKPTSTGKTVHVRIHYH